MSRPGPVNGLATEGAMRILVATDGSSDATAAVEWLAHFPLPAEAEVEVVSAIPRPVLDESIAVSPWRDLRQEAEAIVEDARTRLAKRWPTVTARVFDGDARQAILDVAARERADLVVLGARGLGAVGSFLLGSVSLGVARHAPCPVLVCKGAPRPLRAVTVGLDGSEDAREALRFFVGLPLPSGIAVRLVSVVEPLRYPTTAPSMLAATLKAAVKAYEDDRRRELEPGLAAAADEARARVGSVVTSLPVGSPASSLIEEAARHGSDLVVVGARGRGALKRLVLGSVSETVLRHATCPVLIVRPRG